MIIIRRHHLSSISMASTHKKDVSLLMVIRGTSLGMLWAPSQNKNNAHALIGRKHLRIVVLGLAIPMAICQKANHH